MLNNIQFKLFCTTLFFGLLPAAEFFCSSLLGNAVYYRDTSVAASAAIDAVCLAAIAVNTVFNSSQQAESFACKDVRVQPFNNVVRPISSSTANGATHSRTFFCPNIFSFEKCCLIEILEAIAASLVLPSTYSSTVWHTWVERQLPRGANLQRRFALGTVRFLGVSRWLGNGTPQWHSVMRCPIQEPSFQQEL